MRLSIVVHREDQRDCSESVAGSCHSGDCQIAQCHFLPISQDLALRWSRWRGVGWQQSHSVPERRGSVHFHTEPVLQVLCSAVVVDMFMRDDHALDVLSLETKLLQHRQHDCIDLSLVIQGIDDQEPVTGIVRPCRHSGVAYEVKIVESSEGRHETGWHREELRIDLLYDALIHEVLVQPWIGGQASGLGEVLRDIVGLFVRKCRLVRKLAQWVDLGSGRSQEQGEICER